MASYGFNFRATSAYVTDPSGTTYSIGDTYPQTRNGITFGWTGSPGVPTTRNRSTSVNARVAGINFTPSTTPLTFKIDLPASGQYSVGCAMGDATNAQSTQYIEIFDDSTSLYSMTSSGGPGVNQYYDINGTLHTSDSNWFSNQTYQNLTFSTTTMLVVIGKSGVGSNHTLAHLSISDVVSSGKPWYAFEQQRERLKSLGGIIIPGFADELAYGRGV